MNGIQFNLTVMSVAWERNAHVIQMLYVPSVAVSRRQSPSVSVQLSTSMAAWTGLKVGRRLCIYYIAYYGHVGDHFATIDVRFIGHLLASVCENFFNAPLKCATCWQTNLWLSAADMFDNWKPSNIFCLFLFFFNIDLKFISIAEIGARRQTQHFKVAPRSHPELDYYSNGNVNWACYSYETSH